VAYSNVDGSDQWGLPSEAVIELAGSRIAIRHVLYEGGKLTKDGRAFLDHEQPDICVFGHTHQPKPNGSATRCFSIQGPPALSGSHFHAGSSF
jgi:predicted phosphodiesterase